ncbi:MAG: hypothetical protein Q9218_006909 [Villophora microphyllina]
MNKARQPDRVKGIYDETATPAELGEDYKVRQNYTPPGWHCLETGGSLSTNMPPNIQNIPNEILHRILLQINSRNVKDLGRLSQTCRRLRDFIYDDRHLWRALYRRLLHHTLKQKHDPSLPWRDKFIKLLRAERLLVVEYSDDESKSTLHQWAATLPDHAVDLQPPRFADVHEINNAGLLHASKLQGQLSARLNCLFGPWVFVVFLKSRGSHPSDFVNSDRFILKTIACARARVYDLRQYTSKNRYGPFLNTRPMAVDWEKLEAIQYTLASVMLHLWGDDMPDDIPNRCGDLGPFAGIPSNNFWDSSRPATHCKAVQDPYNITGLWTRVDLLLYQSSFDAHNYTKHKNAGNKLMEPLYDSERFEDTWQMQRMKLRVVRRAIWDGASEPLPFVQFEGSATRIRGDFGSDEGSKITGTGNSERLSGRVVLFGTDKTH